MQFLIDVFVENVLYKSILTRTANMNKPEHNYANNDNNYKYTIKLP